MAQVFAGARGPTSVDRTRMEISACLRERREEIEPALLNRIYGISDPSDLSEPEYLEGLRVAVSAALDYGLAAIEHGDEHSPQIPAVLLVQARMAARLGISLDTVLRRYFAGYALLGDYVLEEAERAGLPSGSIKRLLRSQAALLDRLLADISKEHAREIEARPKTAIERRTEWVRRLLAGELIDTADMGYDFGGHHLGLLAAGEGVTEGLQELAKRFDAQLLVAKPEEGLVWAWLGARRSFDAAKLKCVADDLWSGELRLAIGESWRGLAGWRLTHRQARAALPIAERGRQNVVRYSDVALLASVIQDDLLSISLRELYLAPLEGERDGGVVLRDTLRAYFGAERNLSSAASALGVSRRTVANRLQAVEARLGRPLSQAMSDIEAALRLEELTEPG